MWSWRRDRGEQSTLAGGGVASIPSRNSARVGDIIGGRTQLMGESDTSFTVTPIAEPSADFVVFVFHVERAAVTTDVLTATLGATPLTVSSKPSTGANRDTIAIAWGVIPTGGNLPLTVTTSLAPRALLFTSFYFRGVTTVPEHTLQFDESSDASPVSFSFPWSPAANKELFSCLHVGGVAFNDPSPTTAMPSNYAVTRTAKIPAFGGGRNSGPVYVMRRGVSNGTLLVNGDFSDGTNDWLAANAILTAESGGMRISDNGTFTQGYQVVPTVIGRTYKFQATRVSATGGGTFRLAVGSNNPNQDLGFVDMPVDGTFSVEFVATTLNSYLGFSTTGTDSLLVDDATLVAEEENDFTFTFASDNSSDFTFCSFRVE